MNSPATEHAMQHSTAQRSMAHAHQGNMGRNEGAGASGGMGTLVAASPSWASSPPAALRREMEAHSRAVCSERAGHCRGQPAAAAPEMATCAALAAAASRKNGGVPHAMCTTTGPSRTWHHLGATSWWPARCQSRRGRAWSRRAAWCWWGCPACGPHCMKGSELMEEGQEGWLRWKESSRSPVGA